MSIHKESRQVRLALWLDVTKNSTDERINIDCVNKVYRSCCVFDEDKAHLWSFILDRCKYSGVSTTEEVVRRGSRDRGVPAAVVENFFRTGSMFDTFRVVDDRLVFDLVKCFAERDKHLKLIGDVLLYRMLGLDGGGE